MAKQSVDALIEGGKATAAPPLGPALGPTGVNIGLVVAEINKKTGDFRNFNWNPTSCSTNQKRSWSKIRCS